MSEYIFEWDSLETIGPKGKGFYPNTDHAHNVGRTALRYASIIGLALSLISLAMVMV